MERILAKGHSWELTHITPSDETILQLRSEYGTVEVKAKSLIVLGLFESIEREYLRLADSGPIEKPYICSNCTKPLDFPETLFCGNVPYCFEHVPEYNKESQGW